MNFTAPLLQPCSLFTCGVHKNNIFVTLFIFFFSLFFSGVVKNGLFTARLTVRGGGGSAPLALTVGKCENFGPIFPIIKW